MKSQKILLQKKVNSLRKITSKGETRAFVDLLKLDTLWFNTGTRCNLQCQNCYIESSPTNDELIFISLEDVRKYLDEVVELEFGTSNISFTGGRPFLNKDILPILFSLPWKRVQGFGSYECISSH